MAASSLATDSAARGLPPRRQCAPAPCRSFWPCCCLPPLPLPPRSPAAPRYRARRSAPLPCPATCPRLTNTYGSAGTANDLAGAAAALPGPCPLPCPTRRRRVCRPHPLQPRTWWAPPCCRAQVPLRQRGSSGGGGRRRLPRCPRRCCRAQTTGQRCSLHCTQGPGAAGFTTATLTSAGVEYSM